MTASDPTLRPRRLRRLLPLARVVLWGIVLLWVCGRILTDSTPWSQWLLWLPTPLSLLAAVGLFVIPRPHMRWADRTVAIILVALFAGWIALIDNNVLPGKSPPDGVRLVHWTTDVRKVDAAAWIDAIGHLDADIVILSHARDLLPQEGWRTIVGDGDGPLPIDRFVIASRFPILTARTIVASDGIHITRVVVDTTDAIGQYLPIDVVDLPSDPWRSRREIARSARKMVMEGGVEAAHIAVGDFNMTRPSQSIGRIYPGLVDAWNQSGTGVGGSFPRTLPLLHIDHTLVAPCLVATSYELVDMGMGRHRAQVTTIDSSGLK